MSAGNYYVYILASRHHGTLYIGVTNYIRALAIQFPADINLSPHALA